MRALLALFLFVFLAAGAFASGSSVGIEGIVGNYIQTETASGSMAGGTGTQTDMNTYAPYGVGVFVDATYLQLSANYRWITGYNYQATGSGALYGSYSANYDVNSTFVDFAAYLKIPFAYGPFTVFPLIGAEYDLNLTETDSSGTNLKSSLTAQEQQDLNQLWIEGGAGFDFKVGGAYIRPEGLLGIKVQNATDSNTNAYYKVTWPRHMAQPEHPRR